MDAVFKGHEYLKQLGKYEHMWGVGRHMLGSQVYDYWSDPWGRVHERWADTDRLNLAAAPTCFRPGGAGEPVGRGSAREVHPPREPVAARRPRQRDDAAP